jgi:hypothetical protein
LPSNGNKAANGFEALKDLDSNNDGKIDNQDTNFNNLKIWQDKNSDGKLDEGELLLPPAGNPSKYVSAENLYIKIKNLLFPLKSLKTYFLKARLSL